MIENPFDLTSTIDTSRARRLARHGELVVSRLLAFVILGAVAMPAATQPRKQPTGMSWGELAMLPEYCKDANGIVYGDKYFNTSPNAARWEGLMGFDFWHVHHYCYALNNLRRASSITNPQQKRYLLQKVRGDYLYMINNARPTMVLMPEIWTRMGDVQRMLGDVGEALNAYETAMTLKPDYWPAYKNAADMFLKAGVKPRALQILQRGIAANPDSPELRSSYKAAGGDLARLPAPQPAAVPASAPEAPASSASSP